MIALSYLRFASTIRIRCRFISLREAEEAKHHHHHRHRQILSSSISSLVGENLQQQQQQSKQQQQQEPEQASNEVELDRATKFHDKLATGPNLSHFINRSAASSPFVMKRTNAKIDEREAEIEPFLDSTILDGKNSPVYIKTYGCQMNVSDTAIVEAVLRRSGYRITDTIAEAEIILLMTCAIRENAESKVWHKLRELSNAKRSGAIRRFGLLGCMAERLKTRALEQLPSIDIVAGPDSYRHLPKLLAINRLTGQSAVNVLLSLDETYADVEPEFYFTRTGSRSAYISITRGCDNMCSYCIVPFTRGRERSRPIETIIGEVRRAIAAGMREIVLLGQNVNSYRDFAAARSGEAEIGNRAPKIAEGFRSMVVKSRPGLGFAELLHRVACVDPDVRIRFTSPHPKDFTEDVIDAIATHANIAKGLHIPAQSGSDSVLERMRRGYTASAYISLIDRIRARIPGCAINSDFICGFCGETDEDHRATLRLIRRVEYQIAYIFAYSMREKTHAYHRMRDDVPASVKIERLMELNRVYRELAHERNRRTIGGRQLILLEGTSKKSAKHLYGRNEANQKVILPDRERISRDADDAANRIEMEQDHHDFAIGDFVDVRIRDCTPVTLIADPDSARRTTITQFYATS